PQMVLRVVRAGVPGPEDTRQQLPPAGDQQRVEAEPALVMPGCLLLLGVHVDRSGIEVEDHPLGCRARRPRTGASSCPRRPDPFQLALADRQQHPPRGRHRRHLPEQGWLASQRGQVRDAPTTVGEHHRRSQNTRPGSCPPRRSRVPASASPNPPASPTRSATSASSEVPAREHKPLASALTSTVLTLQRPITFKVNLLSGGIAGVNTAILPAQADVSGPTPSPPRRAS